MQENNKPESTPNPKHKATKRVAGGLVALVGFILSPLSWWNDMLVNIPLSYIFAIPFSWISRSLFMPAFILGYLLSNVLGFVLMHHGLKHALGDLKKASVRLEIKEILLWSALYMVLIVILFALGWVKPPQDY